MIIVVFGLPGSGKSFFAQRLADRLDAGYVNSDRLRKELFAERIYTDHEKAVVYEKMLDEMKHHARHNLNLVLDGTFHKKKVRKMFTDELPEKEKIIFIEIRADEDIIRERVSKPRPYSEADFEVYKLIRDQYEPLEEPHLILKSTNQNIEEMLNKTSEYLIMHHDN
ncbi:MAG: ATP-binding protein [Chitinophagaceae bacterium]|nr:ATP-binding protein [Chitinophagaceae bacterium]